MFKNKHKIGHVLCDRIRSFQVKDENDFLYAKFVNKNYVTYNVCMQEVCRFK